MADTGIVAAYNQVRPKLKRIARRHHDRDEALGEANLAFMRAWHSYDGRGTVAGWAEHVIRRRLRDAARRYAERNRILPRTKLFDQPAPEVFDVTAWLGLLSDDARTLADMALSATDGVSVRLTRQRLRGTLRQLGWRRERIEQAWNEVKEAIP